MKFGLFDADDLFSVNLRPYNAGNLGLSMDGRSSCAQGFNTNSVGSGGCRTTLQLGGAGMFSRHEFDVSIAWMNNKDLSGGQTESFEISDLMGGITLDDFTSIGWCGQATTGTGGSAKEFTIVQASPVPIPAAIWLFASALGFLDFKRRKQLSLAAS